MPDHEPADSALLREFLHQRSEAAFRRLTARHVDLVFGTAQRRTGDRGAAEEITQNVFLALAKKAAWLQSETTLAGWLHRTAVLEATQWWRGELRRRQREEVAAKLETTMKTSDSAGGSELAGALDEALLDLRDGERQAVLLRYFEGKSHREIGAALGIGEDAARKRVDKALEQIAEFFRKRGHAIGGGTAVAALLSGSSQAAPAWLAGQVAGAVLIRALPTGAGWLAKLLGMSGLQTALLSALLIGVPATWQTARLSAAREELARLEGLLGEVGGQRQTVESEVAAVRSQTAQASAALAAAESAIRENVVAELDPLDPRLFLWDEDSEHVRVPKAALQELAFDSVAPNVMGGWTAVFGSDRRVAEVWLDVLQIHGQTRDRLQSYVSESVARYRTFAESQALFGGMEVSPDPAPGWIPTNVHTRVWSMPRLADEVEHWRTQFETGLRTVIGDERARLLMLKAGQDDSLNRIFQDFGSDQLTVVLTPLPSGGCSAGIRRAARWMGVKSSISDVFVPGAFGPAWDGALPAPLTDYLRAWRAEHPNVPNTIATP